MACRCISYVSFTGSRRVTGILKSRKVATIAENVGYTALSASHLRIGFWIHFLHAKYRCAVHCTLVIRVDVRFLNRGWNQGRSRNHRPGMCGVVCRAFFTPGRSSTVIMWSNAAGIGWSTLVSIYRQRSSIWSHGFDICCTKVVIDLVKNSWTYTEWIVYR